MNVLVVLQCGVSWWLGGAAEGGGGDGAWVSTFRGLGIGEGGGEREDWS